MSVNVKKAVLWKIDTANTPGAMAATLGPLADQGANLDIVIGYTNPEKTGTTIEVYPIDAARAQKAARNIGFSKAELPCLVISGKNRAGLGRDIAASLADAGITVNFFIAQVIGPNYVGLFSFEAQSEADLAAKVLRDSLAPGSTRRTANASKKPRTSQSKKRSTKRG